MFCFRCGRIWDDDVGGRRCGGGCKDVIRHEGSVVFGICTDGGKRASVDDSFNLNGHCVEDVDVARFAVANYLQVFLKSEFF